MLSEDEQSVRDILMITKTVIGISVLGIPAPPLGWP
jgi:hypothetical protein